MNARFFIGTLFILGCSTSVQETGETENDSTPETTAQKADPVFEENPAGDVGEMVMTEYFSELEKMQKLLMGTWYLNEWAIGHTLYFKNDGMLTLDNHIDTLYSFNYTLEGGHLLLLNAAGPQEFSNTILYLSKDTLILKNLMNIQEKRLYTREKKSY